MAREPADDLHVAQRLLALRQRLGLSQRELARRANMPNGNLSLIEQGKVSPSIHSLSKILTAVGVSLAEFFAEPAVAFNPVIKPQDFTWLKQRGAKWWWHRSPTERGVPIVLHSTIEPGKRLSGPAAFNTQACLGHILCGRLQLRLAGQNFTAEAGDVLELRALAEVELHNTDSEAARVVWFALPG